MQTFCEADGRGESGPRAVLLSLGGCMQFGDYAVSIGCTKSVDEFLSAPSGLKLRNEEVTAFYIAI